MSTAHRGEMLSISRMGVGAEAYYLSVVASGTEEYYSGEGESPGVWIGSACRELGLAGVVDGTDLSAVLAGRSPADGTELGHNRVPPSRRVAGFDITCSAPKSVSVLYGLGSDAVSREVRDAHHEAVLDALGYLEAHAAWARRGHDGVEALGTSGYVAAGYTHRTSRNGDPQLHTHVLVANVVHGSDGRWSALSSSPLHHQLRTAGYIYQASLRAALTARLGVSFGPVEKGAAEIDGVPKAVLSQFSSRRHEILARLDEIGGSSRRAREIATLDTRKEKTHDTAQLGLRERWRAEGLEAGFGPAELNGLLARTRPSELSHEDVDPIRRHLLGRDGLTAKSSTFERRDVVRAVAERLGAGAQALIVESVADWVMSDSEVVTLEVTGRSGEKRCTTRDLLEVERDLLTRAEAMAKRGARVPDEVVEAVLSERASLSDEQEEMVRFLTTSGKALQVVIGKAGAGKTYALDAARAAFERGGYKVVGTALAARAAAELESGAGIASCSLARFLDLDNLLGLSSRDVVVVDEAGMVGSRQLAELVRFVQHRHASVVLVGDHRQLPEVEAGGVFSAMVRSIGAVELSENRRQQEPWEREALDELRHGEVFAAVVAYDEHGRIHLCESAQATRRSMVADWAKARAEVGSARMYALARTDVEELCVLARAELRGLGELGGDVLEAGGRFFALGDEVLFCRNDRRLRVLNGMRGEVTGLSIDGGLVVRTEDGERSASAEYLAAGHLAHGYASTVHKAQGATVDRAFVLGSDAIYREAGYVAMSRARERTDLYVVTSAFEEAHLDAFGLPLLGETLSASRAKEMALQSLGPARAADLDMEMGDRSTEAGPPAWEQPEDPGRERAVGPLARDLGRAGWSFEAAGATGAIAETERAGRVAECLLGDALVHGPSDHLSEVVGKPPGLPVARSRWARLAGPLQRKLQASAPGERVQSDDQFVWLERAGVAELARELERERGHGLGL